MISISKFIKGLELCEAFFFEIAKPILEIEFPALEYSAGLIGYGSDVLGYDDVVSVDHMWGPRFYLFLKKEDMTLKARIESVLADNLPYTYQGFSVNFSEPDPNDNGIRHAEFIKKGKVSSLIFIYNFEDFVEDYLGKAHMSVIEIYDWLTFSEHRLLALTAGKLFIDRLGIEEFRKKIKFYPEEVKLFMLASNWSIIAEEQAFAKRCGEVGDDTGSRLVTARIVDRLMRLCFLYEDTYAPYSKWYGTAFSKLSIDSYIKDLIKKALAESELTKREEYLVEAQRLVGRLHNEKKITADIHIKVENYFERDIKVIHADKFVDAIMLKLSGTAFEQMPLIATFSQVGNLIALCDNNNYAEKVKGIYKA